MLFRSQLIVVNQLSLEQPRTKDMLALLESLPIEGKRVLMMLPSRDENIVLSTRNIPNAKVQHVSSINVVELLKHDCVIMPRQTVRWIELVFGEGLSAEEATQQIADQLEDETSVEVTEASEAPETEDAEASETADTEDTETASDEDAQAEEPTDGEEE